MTNTILIDFIDKKYEYDKFWWAFYVDGETGLPYYDLDTSLLTWLKKKETIHYIYLTADRHRSHLSGVEFHFDNKEDMLLFKLQWL
jgi:hypothetical protein